MKGLTRNQGNFFRCLAVIGFVALTNYVVNGACSKSEKKLWAYSNPSTEHFLDTYTKYISSDKGERCRWIITTSDDDSYVKLKFSNFDLKNSTKSDKGDCLEIYDGDGKNKLDELCDKHPRDSYASTNRDILVVYKRGDVEGDRKFNMIYSSHSAVSKEKIIQIAGIIGAILAALGLGYVILKVTKCCRCLRTKNNVESNQTTRERDRLVFNVDQGGDTLGNIPNSTANQNTSQPLAPPSNNNSTSPPANQDVAANNDTAHDSDIDSLQEMNELPPSYESLYLNELGESVAPPKYSPPQHRSTHPPRRVNTFN